MGLKFFKPEDFEGFGLQVIPPHEKAADIANAKLEREGKVLYSNWNDSADWWKDKGPEHGRFKYKALLINIEPINKCTHPAEKIRQMNWSEPVEGFNRGLRVTVDVIFQCECGAKVKPKSFEVCE